ncbi:unnamed protein product [Calypogeia fissa]
MQEGIMHIEGFKMEMFSALPEHYLEKDKVQDKTAMNSSAARLDWVRSQIIGQHVEFGTPFGKRLISYCDHTASGRSLQFVENFIIDTVLPVYGNTHTDDSFVGSMTGNIMEEAQKYVKACLGGTADDALLFCGSGSTAAIKKLQEVMGIVVPSIFREHIRAVLPNVHRWVVFVGPYEHHSNLLSWRQSLAEVVEIPLSENGLVDISSLKAALENPAYRGRPKLGSFSAASNVTGILSGTRKIARLLHAHGAFACFDFAACAPYVKIDMRSGQEDGYDAIFISPHKFMGGPGTSGLLLMSKDLYLLKDGPPSTCGGGTVDFVNFDEEKTIYHDEIEHREDAGTPPIVQKIRTALVFCVKEFLTAELIASRESFFIEKAMARLGANPCIDIYGPTTVKRIAVLSFGIRPFLDVPGQIESRSDSENFPANWPDNNSEITPSLDQPQLQWKPKIHKDSTSTPLPSNPIHKKKGTNVFAMHPLKKTILGVARSPLRLQLYRESKSVTEEPPAPIVEQTQDKYLSGRFIVKLLNDLFGIQARGGCSCAATYGHSLLAVDTQQSLAFREEIRKGYSAVKPGWARLSFGYYISHNEFDFILSAIEFIAEYGPRFLQLYDLNWRTGDWNFKQPSQEIQDLIADAEKTVFGDQKRLVWTKSPNFSGPSLFASSTPVDMPASLTEEYKSRLITNYCKVAKYLADRLPKHSPPREIPTEIDPSTITFLT